MMSRKMATPGLLKITVFWNKGYDIISDDEITNKFLSRDSNYIVDLFMWPKYGNPSISMRSYHKHNFIRIWPEKSLFGEVVLVQV